MNCYEISELMSLRLDIQLDDQKEQAFQKHLSSCQVCQAEWEKWRRLDVLFRNAPLIVPETSLVPAVLSRLGESRSRTRPAMGLVLLLVGALLLATLPVLFMLNGIAVVCQMTWPFQPLGALPGALGQLAQGIYLLARAGLVFGKVLWFVPVLAAALTAVMEALLLAGLWVRSRRRLQWGTLIAV